MSLKYNRYLEQHHDSVEQAFNWIRENLPDITTGVMTGDIDPHDISKYSEEEYSAYDAYFYGSEKTDRVKEEFNKTWLHHIHHNAHHWQYWCLIQDDPSEGIVALEMPYRYIVEMICDWWSFSWTKGNLDEIFKWYDEHKNYMKLGKKTRETVEDILEKIRNKLEELEA